jgi:hypothetical protein
MPRFYRSRKNRLKAFPGLASGTLGIGVGLIPEFKGRGAMGVKTTLGVAAAAVVALAVGYSASVGAATSGVKAGVLRCDVKGNVSFIFGSSRDMFCSYEPENGKREDSYTGEIKKFGVDIGYSKHGVILWAVLAPTADVGPGALAGDYGGISADLAVGYGVGANALIGGSNKSIVLQPLSVEGLKGINIAAGIGIMNLRAAQ